MDIEKGQQTHAKKSKDGWIGLVQHYFVSAWLPKGSGDRESSPTRWGENLYTRRRDRARWRSGPGAGRHGDDAALHRAAGYGQARERSPRPRLVVVYGWLYIIAAPLFWVAQLHPRGGGQLGLVDHPAHHPHQLVFYPSTTRRALDGGDEGAGPEDGKAEAALRRRPAEAQPGDDGALPHREDQPAGRVPSDRRADPGVHRALLGAARLHRAAPRAVARMDPGPLRPGPVVHPAGGLRGIDVRADEAQPAAGRSRAGQVDARHAIVFSIFSSSSRRASCSIGCAEPPLHRPAVHITARSRQRRG